jgi:hypothetical protein
MLNDSVGADMLILFNEKASALSKEKSELLDKIEALEDSMKEVTGVVNFADKWKTAGFEEKKAVCQLLIEKIYIAEDGTTEVVWRI